METRPRPGRLPKDPQVLRRREAAVAAEPEPARAALARRVIRDFAG
ncbi:hypothetical protein [Streptomyces sp. NPDC059874]